MILSGSIGAAFGRRYCGCEPGVPFDVRSSSSLSTAKIESLRAASADSGSDVLVREAASTADSFGAKQASRIAELETEIARIKSDQATTRFASMLVASAPADQPLGLAQAMRLLDDSYLTESPEVRAMFVQEVRHDAALALLRDEPGFRSALAAARRADQFEWPVRRDQLVQDFFRRLGEAGLSARTIEHYRATLVDYL